MAGELGKELKGGPVWAALVMLLVGGCSALDPPPPDQNVGALLDRHPVATPPTERKPPPIPDLQPILAAPPRPSAAQRLVSVSVTDPSVPVKDVLVELARKAGVDLDLDPNIGGGVIISAKDRPFSDVIERICEQATLRCSFKDDVLKVEIDRMVNEIYRVDILNSTRTARTDISTSANITSLIQGSSGGGGNNTSTSQVQSESRSDPWREISDNIRQILLNSNPNAQPVLTNVRRKAPGETTPATTPAPVVPVSKPQPPAGVASPTEAGSSAAGGAVAEAAGAVPAQKPVAESAAAPSQAAPQAAAAAAPPVNANQALFSINQQLGAISVFGTSRQQKLVKAYLDKVVSQATAQVLIEAKVVEVTLSDQFNTGIDWSALRQNIRGTGLGITQNTAATGTSAPILALPTPGDLTRSFGSNGFNATFTTFGGDLAAMVNLIKDYGTTRTISSPRLTVVNNQTAVMKVAQNHVYYKLTATVTSTPSTTGSAASQTATYNSQLQTLPIGLIMTVQPSIDLEHDQVTLGLRPTVTAWPGGASVSDPAVALSLASACGTSTSTVCSSANVSNAIASSSVPVIDVREIDSVVTVPSGAVVVMGGLMQESLAKEDTGVPGAMDVPLVGDAFKARSDQTQLTELVVFLKATVIHGTDSVETADKDLYQRYIPDPRPLAF